MPHLYCLDKWNIMPIAYAVHTSQTDETFQSYDILCQPSRDLLTFECYHLSMNICSNYIQKLKKTIISNYIFSFETIPSPIIRSSFVVQLHCQVAHKEIYFKTFYENRFSCTTTNLANKRENTNKSKNN